MESIKARIHGDGIDRSVEFSVEEVIARNEGKSWADMDQNEREGLMKDYALWLYARQEGDTSALDVTLDDGTFARTQPGDV